jgi:hypothetical protein
MRRALLGFVLLAALIKIVIKGEWEERVESYRARHAR